MKYAWISGKVAFSEGSVYTRGVSGTQTHALVHTAFVQPLHTSGWLLSLLNSSRIDRAYVDTADQDRVRDSCEL